MLRLQIEIRVGFEETQYFLGRKVLASRKLPLDSFAQRLRGKPAIDLDLQMPDVGVALQFACRGRAMFKDQFDPLSRFHSDEKVHRLRAFRIRLRLKRLSQRSMPHSELVEREGSFERRDGF